MADFGRAVELVLKHEGGYVWNLNDPGGPTNFGITQAVYSDAIKRIASPDDVKKMSVETAKFIYRQKYWLGDGIASQEVATWLLDMSVLRGITAAVKSAQTALGLTSDGKCGPATLAAINKADDAVFLNNFRSQCVMAFANIVAARPASVEFLQAWLRRAEEMTATVNALCQKTPPQAAPAAAPPVRA